MISLKQKILLDLIQVAQSSLQSDAWLWSGYHLLPTTIFCLYWQYADVCQPMAHLSFRAYFRLLSLVVLVTVDCRRRLGIILGFSFQILYNYLNCVKKYFSLLRSHDTGWYAWHEEQKGTLHSLMFAHEVQVESSLWAARKAMSLWAIKNGEHILGFRLSNNKIEKMSIL